MSKRDKLLNKAKTSPSNLRFTELCQLAEAYGFRFSRQVGSHRIYKHHSYKGIMDFQDNKGKAHSYQVDQLLAAIDAGADMPAETEEDESDV